MKSVAMIAYCFPPDGSAGVFRPLRFVRQLSAMGWRTSVIAAELGPYLSTRHDPGLLELVPRDTEVVRVRGHDLWHTLQDWRARRLQKQAPATPIGSAAQPLDMVSDDGPRSYVRAIARTVESCVYHPNPASGWIAPAVEATISVCRQGQAQVIVASGGPWSSFVVAERASRKTRIPYVLDFRDSWTLADGPFEMRRPAWAQRLDRRTLGRLFAGAQAVILRYPTEAECYWRAYRPLLDSSKIHVIPNGFDGSVEDFSAPVGDRCMVLYTGTMPPYRFDTLLQGALKLKKADPSIASRLRLVFVGDGTEELVAEAAALELSDIVEVRGVVPYAEARRLQASAHALLLLGLKPTRGHEFCGSKVFSYLQAGRPIVGVLPRDETRSILEHVGVSTVGDIESPGEVAAVLQRVVQAWSEGALESLLPDRDAADRYSARSQTGALVRALEAAPPLEPFIPGSVEVPPSLRMEIDEGGWVTA